MANKIIEETTNSNKLSVLLKAYEIANIQHMHEHNRFLTKFNYFLVIELALIASIFVQNILNCFEIAKYILPSLGIISSITWLFSHQRGRVCYETKLAYIKFLEKYLSKIINEESDLLLFSYFEKNHKNYESNLTRKVDTEKMIAWFIIFFIIMWIILLVLFAIGVLNVAFLT